MQKISMPLAALLAVFLSTSALRAEESAGAETAESGEGDTHWIIKSDGHHTRPMQLSVALGFPEYYGPGAMAWFTLPIVHDGFIRHLNDSFDLEFGLMYGVFFWGWGLYDVPPMTLTPLVAARWNFFLTRDWTVFAMVKLGVRIGLNYTRYITGFTGGVIVGGQYRLTENMSLRLETGYPYTSVGLAWDL